MGALTRLTRVAHWERTATTHNHGGTHLRIAGGQAGGWRSRRSRPVETPADVGSTGRSRGSRPKVDAGSPGSARLIAGSPDYIVGAPVPA